MVHDPRKRLTIRVDAEIHDTLTVVSMATERPVSELVAEALGAWAEQMRNDPVLSERVLARLRGAAAGFGEPPTGESD